MAYIRSSIHLLVLSGLSVAWHDLGNYDYHCWPINAGPTNPTPYPVCPGIKIQWLTSPPDDVKVEEPFTVTYQLILEDMFYHWAVEDSQNFFKHAKGGQGIKNATEAREWCENKLCPASSKDANEQNCCVYHANVHACPMEKISRGLCGPWISPSGSIFTHSEVLHGPGGKHNWTSHVKGLVTPGQTSIIGHFKVVAMHIAVEKTVIVRPKTVCGDNLCEGEEGESCQTCPLDCGDCGISSMQIGILSAAVVVFVLVLIIILLYFRWRRHKLLTDLTWIIPYDDLAPDYLGKDGSTFSVRSAGTGFSDFSHRSAVCKQVFTKTRLYKGQIVALKHVPKSQFVMNKKVRIEVFTVRLLDSIYLNKFVGACIEPPNFYIISGYCPKGSLEDILMDDAIPLNWSFRYSFASDIACAMAALHSARLYHGHLSAHNCLMDDRWTVKITDYGLPSLRTAEEGINSDEDEVRTTKEERYKIYVAPELLGEITAAGDVYAYSVILYMIASRSDPMEDALETMSSIKTQSYRINVNALTLHSDTNSQTQCPSPHEYIKLIQNCGSLNADHRPSFEHIKKCIQRMNPSNLSPVDLMMNLMEKYSKHLEQIVEERTRDLMLEKQRTDMLLYSMLPKAVADELRQGNTVGAEMFDMCTIYFSDIVGFTTICGNSLPLQVVAFLNNLYTCFDQVMENHDVYKVETIGDAYMVVSGLPNPTEHHASEIINMALELVAVSRVFVIPHIKDMPLKIRVGIHTGPVCAGVVGLKMPRYCLFGDTVNTASRMESNGEEYKIHTSNDTYTIACGKYEFTYRGTITIKGKGDMQTWWLLGKKA